MPIGVILDFPGGTLDQYDEVIGKMGLTRGGAGPPAALFHWATQTDKGLRVIDVWESREAFDRFAQEQIGPYSQEVGMPGPPQTTFYEVHNYLTAG